MASIFWRTGCPACCVAYKCSNSSKSNPEKTIFTLPKNEYTRKAWIAVLKRKEGSPVQSQHTNINQFSAQHCSDVIALLLHN